MRQRLEAMIQKLTHPLSVLVMALSLMGAAATVTVAHVSALGRIERLEARDVETRALIESLAQKLDRQAQSAAALDVRMERLDVTMQSLKVELERDRLIRGYSR